MYVICSALQQQHRKIFIFFSDKFLLFCFFIYFLRFSCFFRMFFLPSDVLMIMMSMWVSRNQQKKPTSMYVSEWIIFFSIFESFDSLSFLFTIQLGSAQMFVKMMMMMMRKKRIIYYPLFSKNIRFWCIYIDCHFVLDGWIVWGVPLETLA